MAENDPKGPVGLLIQSVNTLGGILTTGCELLLPNEAPVEIRTTPFQCLAKLALAGATRRRMIAEANASDKWRQLEEVDHDILDKAKNKWDPAQVGTMRMLHNGWGLRQKKG